MMCLRFGERIAWSEIDERKNCETTVNGARRCETGAYDATVGDKASKSGGIMTCR